MYKYTKQILPKIFVNYFIQNNDVHDHNTRSADHLRVTRYESTLGHNSFRYNAIKVWNEVGYKLYVENNNISYNCFKKKVKLHLLQQKS